MDEPQAAGDATVSLAVCAEMVFLDLPFAERVRRIDDLGFQVKIWDWTRKDVQALARTGARFSSMTGYVTGSLADPDGAEDLLLERFRAASSSTTATATRSSR
jgi:hydroxypyruvate isomerase